MDVFLKELARLAAVAVLDLARAALRVTVRPRAGKPQPLPGRDVIHINNQIAKGARAFPPVPKGP